MNWEEFALKILPILQQILQVLDHTTPEGRHLLAAHRTRLLGELRQMRDALEPPPKPPTKVEAKALEPPPKPPAKADAKEAAKPEAKEAAKADAKDKA
jgi:hypothetical protein